MPVLRHPDLPGQTITVADESVWHYERSGWKADKPKTPKAPTDPPAEPETNNKE